MKYKRVYSMQIGDKDFLVRPVCKRKKEPVDCAKLRAELIAKGIIKPAK